MNYLFSYPANFISANFLASLGVPLYVGIKIQRDDEANVFTASSKQIPGLFLEGATLDEIRAEAYRLIPELLSVEKNSYSASKHSW